MRVTYFANDLSEPAIARRVRMLLMGGADVRLAGFRRTPQPVPSVEGVPAIDLGQTFNSRLASRFGLVLRQSVDTRALKPLISGSDALLARNLEMATIAYAAKIWARSSARLAYECLDLHSVQLGTNLPSKLLRAWERHILNASSNLITSSPGFVSKYFSTLGVSLPEVILAENKRVLVDDEQRPSLDTSERQPPWRIGWFGYLRCTESFQILLAAANRQPGVIDVQLRGRPIPEVQRLIDQHLPLPNMRFGGPYAQSDLGAIYRDCDFTWAIEYVGQNEFDPIWGLGNRLYEGGFYNIPSIVLMESAMGEWLRARDTGVCLKNPRVDFESFLSKLTLQEYQSLRQSAARIPTDDLMWTIEGCREFTRRIAGH